MVTRVGPEFFKRTEEAVKLYKEILAHHSNDTPIFHCKVEDFEDIEIVPISDAHIGSRQLDLDLLIKKINYAKNKKNAILLLTGDLLDTAIIGSVSNVYEAAISPNEQVLAAINLIYEVSDKVAVIIRGNHTYRLDKVAGMNPKLAINLATSLEGRYAGNDAVIILENSKEELVTIYAHHGSGIGGSSEVGVSKSIEDISSRTTSGCDICMYGHKHISSFTEREVSIILNGEAIKKKQTLIMLPAFLDKGGYGSFYNYKTPITQQQTYRIHWIDGKPCIDAKDFKYVSKKSTKKDKDDYNKYLEKLEEIEKRKQNTKVRVGRV